MLKKSRIVHKKLWELSNYDCFIMQFCPTLNNKISGIGVFFLFQILIVFTSTVTAYKVFIDTYLIGGILLGIAITIAFYKWIKLINQVHQTKQLLIILVAQALFNLVLSCLLSVPFLLYLFEHQILLQFYLKNQSIQYGLIDQLLLKPVALYESWFVEKEGNLIIFICIAITLLITFIFITPYFSIYKNKKSTYTLAKKNYERNFK